MVNSSNALMPPFPPSIGNESFVILIDKKCTFKIEQEYPELHFKCTTITIKTVSYPY